MLLASSTGAQVALTRFKCARCAYGASSRIAPERCPMCGGTVWMMEKPDGRRSLTPSRPTAAGPNVGRACAQGVGPLPTATTASTTLRESAFAAITPTSPLRRLRPRQRPRNRPPVPDGFHERLSSRRRWCRRPPMPATWAGAGGDWRLRCAQPETGPISSRTRKPCAGSRAYNRLKWRGGGRRAGTRERLRGGQR